MSIHHMAKVIDGVVENVIVVDEPNIPEFEEMGYITVDKSVGRGHKTEDNGVTFIEPDREIIEFTEISRFKFLSRWTPGERKAAKRLSKTNEDIEDFMLLLEMAGSVDLTLPETKAGMQMLLDYGVFDSQARVDEILEAEKV